MSYASVQDTDVNPNNKAQYYVLWGSGRIDNEGGAPPILNPPQWFDWMDQPVGVAIHITDWATGAGYVLDMQGGFHPLNGAPELAVNADGDPNTPNEVVGVPYVFRRKYVDWSWNPTVAGHGVVLDAYGQLFPFGGATDPPRTGPRWAQPVARKLQMLWTSGVRAVTLDYMGGLHWDYSDPLVLTGYPYWAGQDAARDFVVTDWNAGKGYTLDLYGAPQPFGGAPYVYGFPYSPGADVARTLDVVSSSDPIRFRETWSQGQRFEWVSSTPPTVTAGGVSGSPAATVTATSRPTLAWSYSDAQGDSQTAWELLPFTQGFATANSMTDPARWAASALAVLSGSDRTARGTVADLDFANGSYRYYVRAKDSAGQWSAWSNRGWTQNVPVPVAPSGLVAEPNSDPAKFQIHLALNATTGGSAKLVRFEASDDGGSTWQPVRGAEAVTLTSTVQAVDYDIPFGVTRAYRAVAYSVTPRTASAPTGSVTARIGRLVYALTVCDDPNLGGEIHATGPAGWSRPAAAGVFEGIGAEFPTVVSDGVPKARRFPCTVMPQDRGQWDALEAVAMSNSTLVYRDPFGEVTYCRLVGDWSRSQVPAAPLAGEVTPLRHLHTSTLPLVEVQAPQRLAVRNAVPPGPVFG